MIIYTHLLYRTLLRGILRGLKSSKKNRVFIITNDGNIKSFHVWKKMFSILFSILQCFQIRGLKIALDWIQNEHLFTEQKLVLCVHFSFLLFKFSDKTCCVFAPKIVAQIWQIFDPRNIWRFSKSWLVWKHCLQNEKGTNKNNEICIRW